MNARVEELRVHIAVITDRGGTHSTGVMQREGESDEDLISRAASSLAALKLQHGIEQ